jgi:hypothetical protein
MRRRELLKAAAAAVVLGVGYASNARAQYQPSRGRGRSGNLVALPSEAFTARGSTCREFIYSLRLGIAGRRWEQASL